MATKGSNRAQSIRQWGSVSLQKLVTGQRDDESFLWLLLHADGYAAELGLTGTLQEKRAEAIRRAFGEEEPITGQQIVNAQLAAKAGGADAVAFLTRCGMAVP